MIHGMEFAFAISMPNIFLINPQVFLNSADKYIISEVHMTIFNDQYHVETSDGVLYVYMTVSQIENFRNLKKIHGFKVIKARQCSDMIIAAVLI